MTFKVYDKENNYLGILSFSKSKKGEFIAKGSTSTLDKLVIQMQKEGITQTKSIHDLKNKLSSIVSGPIESNDPNYPLAFKGFMEQKGYRVAKQYPKIEQEIRDLLVRFPEGVENKQEIEDSLPQMSHLEQTYILKSLKQFLAKEKPK